MSLTTIVVLLLAIPLVIWAIRADSRRWTTKSREELLAMVSADDWRYWKLAVKELKRRGEDPATLLPSLLPRLLSDTLTIREAARITLASQFPELLDRLADYRSADDVADSRRKLASLFAQYGIGGSGSR